MADQAGKGARARALVSVTGHRVRCGRGRRPPLNRPVHVFGISVVVRTDIGYKLITNMRTAHGRRAHTHTPIGSD